MSKDMNGREKLIFITSFIWFLHWATCITYNTLAMVIANTYVKMSPIGF